MYKIEIDKNGLLELKVLKGEGPNKKDLYFSGKTLNIKTNNKLVITYWKNKFGITQLKNVGSGFSVVKCYNKTEKLINNINKEYLKLGLSIFKQLDVNEENVLSYLYKFPQKGIEEINKILNNIGIDNIKADRTKESKYVYMKGLNNKYSDIKTKMDEAIKNNKWEEIFSFILGIIISKYANVKINKKDKIFQGIVFQIPVIGDLYINKSIIDDLFYKLREEFVLSLKLGFVYQSGSHDPEFDEIILKIMKKAGILTNDYKVGKKEVEGEYLDKLKNFLKEKVEGIENRNDIDNILDKYKIKLCEK